jgi:outer membrane protein assembly factor BamA
VTDGSEAALRAALRRLLPVAVSASAFLAGAQTARAQDVSCDPGDRQVLAVDFSGNKAIRSAELANAIVTTPSSFLRRRLHIPLGAERCLDSLEFRRDAYRIRILYYQRGYRRTTVEPVIRDAGARAVKTRFEIHEGPPVIIDSLRVTGLDTLKGGRDLLAVLEPLQGAVFDQNRVRTAVDSVIERLHNQGYPRADRPLESSTVDSAKQHATLDLDFRPGSLSYIGAIQYDIAPYGDGKHPAVDSSTVRKMLSFKPGDLYRERDLFRSQRDLYNLEIYRHVEVRLAADSEQVRGDSSLLVLTRLSEAPMRSLRVGAGWATLDCFRTQARFIHHDLLGHARRLELTGRVSKLGSGQPLAFAPGLCTEDVRRDPFSDTLNYYGGATLRLPALFGPRNVPSFTLYTERRSEFRVYLRNTFFGGVASLTRDQFPRTPITVSYQIETGQTVAERAVFCSVFNLCDLNDIDRLNGKTKRQGTVSLVVSHDQTDIPFDPTSGYQARGELRHASTIVGSDPDIQFSTARAEGSIYHRVSRSGVFAARLQLGGVFAEKTAEGAQGFVPPQERLYGGGPNSVRGFAQNQLGPVVYILQDSNQVELVGTTTAGETIYRIKSDTARVNRTVPTGGNLLAVTNLEYRFRTPLLRDLVEWTAFVDGGIVTNRNGASTLGSTGFKWTPGMGVRVSSPVGPIRVDVAYNGYPNPPGTAYLELFKQDQAGRTVPSELRCIRPVGTTSVDAPCGADFAPRRASSFFQRLTFQFNIGQAF